MGLIDKIKNTYDYHKVDKYTKRRVSQSQFQSQDRRYYETAYRDGDYLDPQDMRTGRYDPNAPTSTHLSYKQSRWSFTDLLTKNNSKKPMTVATSQIRTSESYTLGGRA
ncbi:uncharacterized protein B0P05DRAFT_578230 [Gilbertella persicaria]|uniref:Uncharacterized protein n=1 Tax=Rhizopus stolonifer TaxID=4846 RepID=A0A367KKG3_RHIST|nr:uncharacterized protein B0P05DRAFT_578230 [Gilbertella persicaria]KAI8085831.1 hypothetical protein B0P05DRAFT_578230 [Gilbertella persicaria]RCI02686.1 hypothetical protein CU098_011524 [Rhizopus stolonifer]